MYTGVSLIFLLSGLSLRVDQLASAAKNLKLNAAIQVYTFVYMRACDICADRSRRWTPPPKKTKQHKKYDTV